MPPEGLGQVGLFLWLTFFAIVVRGAMTLYHVPHLAMGAELSNDYAERTSIVAYRTLLAVIGGILVTILSYQLFFPETAEYVNGLLNASGYPKYAAFAGIVMFVTIWYSAWGTRKEIPRLPKAPENPEPFSFRRPLDYFLFSFGVLCGNGKSFIFIRNLRRRKSHVYVILFGESLSELIPNISIFPSDKTVPDYEMYL